MQQMTIFLSHILGRYRNITEEIMSSSIFKHYSTNINFVVFSYEQHLECSAIKMYLIQKVKKKLYKFNDIFSAKK